MKPMKKVGSYYKPLNPKAMKRQDSTMKSKSDIEISSKELTELEKETFSIKINDLEMRLNRKKQLCSFLDEEKQFFETEYRSKKILKKESMTILNKAYQELYLESLLLEDEICGMEAVTNRAKSLRKKENIHATKRREQLGRLEKQLESKLNEVEKNIEDIPDLTLQFHELQGEIRQKNQSFDAQISNLNSDFSTFIRSLQDELKTVIERIIQDGALKLNLLPVPYQALFESGILGNSWFECVLKTCETLLQQNIEVIKNIEKMKLSCRAVRETSRKDLNGIVLPHQARELFSELEQDLEKFDNQEELIFPTALKEFEPEMEHLLQLNNKSVTLEKDIKALTDKIEALEKDIKEKEVFDDNCEERSHLLQVILQAKDVIIQEL